MSPTDLLRRLKDEGDFNPTYMASTVDEAADKFQDLADKHFLKKTSRLTCDQQCVDTREQLLGLMLTANKLPPSHQVELRPDLSNMREEISPAVINFAFHQMQQTRSFDQSFTQPQQSFFGAGQPTLQRQGSPFFRGKRGVAGIGGEDDVDSTSIGTEIVLYCWKAGEEDGDKGLHKLCPACRSVRRLPDIYFPNFFNQVLCRGGKCLGGNGECVQQYISLRILKNNGTKTCQNWLPQSIQVSVCCDCMVRTSSSLYQLAKQTP